MPDIRYICLSDMHLGEEDNLLTNLKPGGMDIDPKKPSPVMEHLVECLRYLINQNEGGKKPTLILNGDILELALCTTDQASMVFERFIELIMKEGDELFEDIIYIPGNHDHHFWEVARETQYVHYMKRKIKPGDTFDPPWHVTDLFPENQKEAVSSYFLTNLIRRYSHLREKEIKVFYPNLGLKNADGKKCVIFTHGHYIEPIYKLMTILKGMLFPRQKRPLEVHEIEAENFAWIDFFWSTMGRSGQIGRDVEVIYEKLQYVAGFKNIIENLSRSLAERLDLPGWGDWMERNIVNSVLQNLMRDFSKRERGVKNSALSFEAERGLEKFVTGPLHDQILDENDDTIPADVTIVFGHTHKPFQKDMHFAGYPGWVNVYNTGGWVVETVKPESLHGAAVVILDEELHATSLRMYNEAFDSRHYLVRVEEARHAGEKTNPFHERIRGIVDPLQDPWKSFSEVVADTILERAENLNNRIIGRGYVEKQ